MSSDSAFRSYGQASNRGGAPRDTEGRALLESARRMTEAQARPDDIQGMKEVARLNWRLWTIFQAEITQPECPLPPEVRNNMLNLCNFVDKHTVRFLANPEPKSLDVLINVNRQIAAGLLSGDPGGQSDGPSEVPPSGQGTSTGGITV